MKQSESNEDRYGNHTATGKKPGFATQKYFTFALLMTLQFGPIQICVKDYTSKYLAGKKAMSDVSLRVKRIEYRPRG